MAISAHTKISSSSFVFQRDLFKEKCLEEQLFKISQMGIAILLYLLVIDKS